MSSIVIDKSYLQGTSSNEIKKLALNNRLLMSDALFYELLTTKPEYRCLCFNKFPKNSNPVDLIDHIGVFMNKEINTHKPSGPPSQHIETFAFKFNEKLTDIDYSPPTDSQTEIEKETSRIKENVYTFLERAKVIQSFFPNLLEGSQMQRDKAHMEAEVLIVTPKSLSKFIGQLKLPVGEKELPPADSMNDSWAIYRWLQVQLLFALDVYVRYQANIPKELSLKTYLKMEHDVLDAELLALGCLEGSFATKEKKHIRWWQLLCQSGQLYE
ncbi:hypothetical protein MNBD_GAMMA12-1418 [hydrothermal vent metagenome]|uniref:Uncharacterized protein n=1 Tax=hydrothermal vent metagenome TaxID=652676 RepID=A0A3B0Z759_9ZZZZ